MKPPFLVVALAFGLLAGSRGPAGQEAELPSATPVAAVGESVVPAPFRSFGVLAGFVENRGQWDPEVLFHARAGGVALTLTRDALVFVPVVDPERAGEGMVEPLVLRLPGPAVHVEGEQELATRHHFFLGARSASDVSGFARVVYRDVLPGIDVRLRMDGSRFAYDLLTDPCAPVESFEIGVGGAEHMEAFDDTNLAVHTSWGVVEQTIGASWEDGPGGRIPVAASFDLRVDGSGPQCFGFSVPGRDSSRPLVIDPTLGFATYVGGFAQELVEDAEVDDAGATYLLTQVGQGTPVTPGALQSKGAGLKDAWVGKVSPDGTALEWGTFLGGSDAENVAALALGGDGSVVVVGDTWSSDFPTTPGALQTVHGSSPFNSDAFVARLDPSGSSLVWSSLFGGPDTEKGTAVAVLPGGDVVVGGDAWNGAPFPAQGFDPTFDVGDQMLFRLSADGASLVFLTYFKTSRILDLAVDASSNVYLAGYIFQQDAPLPTTPGAFQETMFPGDASNGFVAKVDPTGQNLLWATYLGGDEGGDTVWGMTVDASSAVYVAGQTSSDDFPVTPGAFDMAGHNGYKGFTTKLLPGGSGLVWSTYLGTTCECQGSGYLSDVDIDSAGNVWASGSSNEPGFPTTPDALQPTFIGPFPTGDAHLTKLDAFGESLVYSTWFGGSGTDYFTKVGVAGDGAPILAVSSSSRDLPITAGAYQTKKAGSLDLVVARFELPLLPWLVLGGGLTGSTDTPNLAGAGPLSPGSTTRLSVRGAAASSPALLVVGLTQIDFPYLGGTFVPSPDFLLLLATDGLGGLDFTTPWPGIPAGIPLFAQFWIPDPGAVQGWSATNAVGMTSQ